MTPTLAQIWRYPIKGIGAERMQSISLTVDAPLPMDRAWAVLEAGGDRSDGWRSCRNFLRGAKGPSLMAVRARLEGAIIHLSHPDQPDIQVDPDADPTAFFEWVAQIYPEDRPAPMALVQAPTEGMADAPYASISILNLASLRALSQRLGRNLDVRRFRANFWIDGLAPWEEFDLVGRRLMIGHTCLEVIEPITRCRATESNPETGRRDAATLRALEDGWGHRDFGVYAMVRSAGSVTEGDPVRLQ